MKLFWVLAVLVLVSCQSPTSQTPSKPDQSTSQTTPSDPVTTPTTTVHVIITKDALWNDVVKTVVDTSTGKAVMRSASGAITTTDATVTSAQQAAQAAADAYNAATLDDFYRVYVDESPDLSNAPPANVFVCNPDTHIPNMTLVGVSRQQLVDNIEGYRKDAFGQILYIDHIPPAPVLAKDATPFEYYSIYVIEDAPTSGTILYEDHAGYTSDEVWHGQWITTPVGQNAPDGTSGGGWASLDAYYDQMLHIYQQSIAFPQSNWPGVTAVHLVTREVYPPLPDIITKQ